MLASTLVLMVIGMAVADFALDGGPLGQGFSLAAGLLAAFGFYGPGYLLLSRYAWRGVRGTELRESLRASGPPKSRLVREFLVGGPSYWAMYAAFFSLLAVIILAMSVPLGTEPFLIAACLLCVSGSWVLLVASFAVEYAREWATSSGLRFPDNEPETRTFGDFIYTAVQVSTTFSSSDVAITNQRTRRLVTVNAIAAFSFSTVIIALLVALVLGTVV